MATPEHIISGRHTGQEPTLLYAFSPLIFAALARSFEAQRVASNNSLPAIMVRTDPASDLVLGKFISPQDTMFTRRPDAYGTAAERATLEADCWVQGTKLYSPMAIGNNTRNFDGNEVLMLDSLDNQGDPLQPGYMGSIEVGKAALTGLYITTRNHIPQDSTGQQTRLFDPMFYLQ